MSEKFRKPPPRRKPSPEFVAELRKALLPQPKPLPPPKPTADEVWNERQRTLSIDRYQRAIDAVWERTLQARAEVEARGAASCHRGPADSDWSL